MSSRTARRFGYLIPLASALVVGTTAASHPQSAVLTTGVTFKLVLTLRPPPTRTAKFAIPSTIHGTGTFANGRGRIDIDSSSGPMAFTKGDYFVIDSGHTLLVRPSVQTCAEIESPMQNSLGVLLNAMNNQQIVVSGVKVAMEKLGATDSVGNLHTQQYRIQSAYVLDLGARDINTEITTDMWVAKLPFRFANPVVPAMRSPRMPAALNALFDTISTYSTRIAGEGVPVRVVTTTTYTVGTMTWDTMQSAEISGVREISVDEASFRVPDRFKKGGQ